MRNALVITSILFAAVACDRDATTNVPGEGGATGATGTTGRLGSTDTTGTADHDPTGTTEGAGTGGAASRTGDGNSATTANGTRTGTMGSRGSVDTETTGTTGSTGTDPWDRPSGPTGPTGGIARSDDHAMSCAQLIPRLVQRQYLPNMTLTPASHGTDIATNCRIEGRGVHAAANVQAWCNPDEDSAMQPDTPPASEPSMTVGKAAILVDAGELQHLVAWDSDSSCQITLAVPRTVDAMALGRRMLDALPARPVVGIRDEEG